MENFRATFEKLQSAIRREIDETVENGLHEIDGYRRRAGEAQDSIRCGVESVQEAIAHGHDVVRNGIESLVRDSDKSQQNAEEGHQSTEETGLSADEGLHSEEAEAMTEFERAFEETLRDSQEEFYEPPTKKEAVNNELVEEKNERQNTKAEIKRLIALNHSLSAEQAILESSVRGRDAEIERLVSENNSLCTEQAGVVSELKLRIGAKDMDSRARRLRITEMTACKNEDAKKIRILEGDVANKGRYIAEQTGRVIESQQQIKELQDLIGNLNVQLRDEKAARQKFERELNALEGQKAEMSYFIHQLFKNLHTEEACREEMEAKNFSLKDELQAQLSDVNKLWEILADKDLIIAEYEGISQRKSVKIAELDHDVQKLLAVAERIVVLSENDAERKQQIQDLRVQLAENARILSGLQESNYDPIYQLNQSRGYVDRLEAKYDSLEKAANDSGPVVMGVLDDGKLPVDHSAGYGNAESDSDNAVTENTENTKDSDADTESFPCSIEIDETEWQYLDAHAFDNNVSKDVFN